VDRQSARYPDRAPESSPLGAISSSYVRLLPAIPRHEVAHLVGGVGLAVVVAPRELRDVAVQVLGRHLVVDADVPALHHRPKGLHPVRVDLAADVLGDRVLDAVMLERDVLVHGGFVGVDGGVRGRVPDRCSWSVALPVRRTILARTCRVARSLMPATAVFVDRPPSSSLRRARRRRFDMFIRFPPKYASSASTGPANSPVPSSVALRNWCSRNQADFWAIPSSRWSFKDEIPLMFVVNR